MFSNPQIFYFTEALIFASVIFMHVSKKNVTTVSLYTIQSLLVVILLFSAALKERSAMLLLVALAAMAIKVIIAPHFFRKLIKKNQLKFAVSTYLNGPMTLMVLAILTAFTYSHYFKPLALLSEQNSDALSLAVASVLISVFLIINRKGALSQMVGVLSLENAIVSFAFLAGLEQTAGIQLGIIFDITIWVIIATVFASMVYKQFGTLNVAAMSHLKEE